MARRGDQRSGEDGERRSPPSSRSARASSSGSRGASETPRDSFSVRVGRIGRAAPGSFRAKLNRAVAKARAASGKRVGAKPSGRFNVRGRGAKVAPGLKVRGGWEQHGAIRYRARRVIVKARVVKLKGALSKGAAHLRYLQREGVGLERSDRDARGLRDAPDRDVREPGSDAPDRSMRLMAGDERSRDPRAASLGESAELAAKGKETPELAAPLERSTGTEFAAPEFVRVARNEHDPERRRDERRAAEFDGADRDSIGAKIDRAIVADRGPSFSSAARIGAARDGAELDRGGRDERQAPFPLAAISERAARDGFEAESQTQQRAPEREPSARELLAEDVRERAIERASERSQNRGGLYNWRQDEADGKAFLNRSAGDRHQFRLIVSPEDGAELGDLRPFTRGLMREMERDLGTGLDWVAVDHYDTGHPHAHIVIRGVTEDGKTLNIAGDYIAHGIRARASEQLTLELGLQSEIEVARSLGREAHQEGWTRLDRRLQKLTENSRDATIDLRPEGLGEMQARVDRHALIARAKHLESLGLAEKERPGVWRLMPFAEDTLKRMGERAEHRAAMQRAMDRAGVQRTMAHDAPGSAVVGRLIGKELGRDELKGDLRLVIDGADGKLRCIEIAATHAASEAKLGAIIEIGPPTLKAADKTILALAAENDGIYNPVRHAERLEQGRSFEEAVELAKAHVRRLEALRREKIAERREDGSWRIPEDYAEKALAYEARGAKTATRVLTNWTLEAQIGSDGATWLDRTLLSAPVVGSRQTELVPSRVDMGFGLDVANALHARSEKLIKDGLAVGEIDETGRSVIRYRRNLLAALQARELTRVGEQMATKSGKHFHIPEDGARIEGVYARAIELASGKFAVIEKSREFALVPWRPLIEKDLGRHVSGVARGLGIDWDMGRKRELGLSR